MIRPCLYESAHKSSIQFHTQNRYFSIQLALNYHEIYLLQQQSAILAHLIPIQSNLMGI